MSHHRKANDPGKYVQLMGTIMLSALGFALAMTLVFLLMRLFFEALKFLPWLDYLYVAFIICVPAAIFFTAYLIFFKKSLHLSNTFIKYFSLTLFVIMLTAWLAFFMTDLVSFIRFQYTNISEYYSFNILFLFANVLVIFFVGVMQALAAPPEKDWMERNSTE